MPFGEIEVIFFGPLGDKSGFECPVEIDKMLHAIEDSEDSGNEPRPTGVPAKGLTNQEEREVQ